MDKAKILQAVANALDSMGLEPDADDIYDENGLTSANEVPVWSKLDVSVDDPGRGPIHSRDAIFKGLQMSKPPTVDNYGMPAAGDQEEMMTALGLV